MKQYSASKNEIVERIITINRAWKIALENIVRANDSEKLVCQNIAQRLQIQKSNWQALLIREYSEQVWLKHDQENDSGETLYSVRFGNGFFLSDFSWKQDAEHLPKRIAEQILTSKELERALQPKQI